MEGEKAVARQAAADAAAQAHAQAEAESKASETAVQCAADMVGRVAIDLSEEFVVSAADLGQPAAGSVAAAATLHRPVISMDIGEWLAIHGASDCEASLRANGVESLQDFFHLIEEKQDLEFAGLDPQQTLCLWPILQTQKTILKKQGRSSQSASGPEPKPEPEPELEPVPEVSAEEKRKQQRDLAAAERDRARRARAAEREQMRRERAASTEQAKRKRGAGATNAEGVHKGSHGNLRYTETPPDAKAVNITTAEKARTGQLQEAEKAAAEAEAARLEGEKAET
eukprot:COSAG01_NODE_18019_length_1105_cov_1.330020_1_plen_284_part_00